MSFNQFAEQAWAEHSEKTHVVAQRLREVASLYRDPEQVAQLAGLVTHVYGEHLGQWQEGLDTLWQLGSCDLSDPAVRRSAAALRLASGQDIDWSEFSDSDRIRVLALASSALAGQGQTQRAALLFQNAIGFAGPGLDADEAALKALAITGNNLACAMEEKSARTEDDTRLMLLAAHASLKFWRKAGTWIHEERAEYRLAKSLTVAGRATEALDHANACLAICEKNGAESFEMFFAWEAFHVVVKAQGDQRESMRSLGKMQELAAQLSGDDKAYCEMRLRELLV